MNEYKKRIKSYSLRILPTIMIRVGCAVALTQSNKPRHRAGFCRLLGAKKTYSRLSWQGVPIGEHRGKLYCQLSYYCLS